MKITASIVLYNSESSYIIHLVDSLILQGVQHVYLIDNAPINLQKDFVQISHLTYLHNPTNPGFGAAHNIAIDLAIKAGSNFHFIVNPDIQLGDGVIKNMADYMNLNSEVGLMMPQVLNADGTTQFLPKLLPTPWSLFRRKFKWPTKSYFKFLETYELRGAPSSQIYQSPIISGCFALLNLTAVRKVGSFDESFFMYFEDFDLSRRMQKQYKTIYFPLVHVVHGYDSGANKNFMLLYAFICSAIKYFNKWGWLFDKDRGQINKKTLSQFQL